VSPYNLNTLGSGYVRSCRSVRVALARKGGQEDLYHEHTVMIWQPQETLSSRRSRAKWSVQDCRCEILVTSRDTLGPLLQSGDVDQSATVAALQLRKPSGLPNAHLCIVVGHPGCLLQGARHPPCQALVQLRLRLQGTHTWRFRFSSNAVKQPTNLTVQCS
jgi:hypothetical protein